MFCCLPHGASAAAALQLLPLGKKVIDLSADYRLSDPAVYAEWYGLTHADPSNLKDAVYGLPELYRDEIRQAPLVANPGCYPTSAILALAPLLEAGVIEPTGIIIDSKSGVCGAGRAPKLTSTYPECNESVSAYDVGTHRHTPEIEQVLTDVAGRAVEVIFTPHLIPMDRGILSTIYAIPHRRHVDRGLLSTLPRVLRRRAVRPRGRAPAGHEGGLGHELLRHHGPGRPRPGRRPRRIDNLIKGASGVAVQNFNLMCGFPETTALL